MGKYSVSLKDMAQRLEISEMTVSRALNGKSGVSEKTRRLILEELERIGYRKNSLAATLRMAKSFTIGVVIHSLSSNYHSELFDGIQNYAKTKGFEERDRVKFLIEKIVEYNFRTLEFWLNHPIDGILFQDDWGTQRQLIINPNAWRELFKPYYKELFDAVHRSGRHVYFHTDGNTIDIIPDLIEIGVDVLNPQFSAMNLEDLAKITAGRVCIRSDIDRQYILTKATPEEVDLYVKRIIELFNSKDGGFIGMGEINSDSKLENVEAMYEAFEKYGRY